MAFTENSWLLVGEYRVRHGLGHHVTEGRGKGSKPSSLSSHFPYLEFSRF